MRLWAIVPAAGVGRRLGATIPKQYLPLAGSTVIEQSIDRLLAVPRIDQIVVAVGADDPLWPTLSCARHARVRSVVGGAERQESVLNALALIREEADAADWVIVHDAVRPCVNAADIERLIDTLLASEAAAGLLVAAMDNTVKRQESAAAALQTDEPRRVGETLKRGELWNALTPQMCRLDRLYSALTDAAQSNAVTTDESSALERVGENPLMVVSDKRNIKITHASDLVIAGAILSAQALDTSQDESS